MCKKTAETVESSQQNIHVVKTELCFVVKLKVQKGAVAVTTVLSRLQVASVNKCIMKRKKT